MEKILRVTDEYITCASDKIQLPTDSESFIDYLKSCIPLCSTRECLFESLESFRHKRLVSATDSVGLLTKRVLRMRAVKSVLVYSCTLSLYSALTGWEEPLEDLAVYFVECSFMKGRSSVLMDKLGSEGVKAYYVNLTALATVLPIVDLVLIGSETIYADGSIKAVSGSSVLVLMATEHKIPVYVLYETVKLSLNVYNPTMRSVGFEVVPRRFPMSFISENEIHRSILGFSKRCVNIPT